MAPTPPPTSAAPAAAGSDTATTHALGSALRDTTDLQATSRTAGTAGTVPTQSKHINVDGPPAMADPAQSSTAEGLKDSLGATTELQATSKAAGTAGRRPLEGEETKHIAAKGPPSNAAPEASSTGAALGSALAATTKLQNPPRGA